MPIEQSQLEDLLKLATRELALQSIKIVDKMMKGNTYLWREVTVNIMNKFNIF